MIQVLQLGQIEYQEAQSLQQRLVELRKHGRIADTLLLLEHSPVITLGRNAKRQNVLLSRKQLEQRGVQLIECDRGGDVTYHGPGQLVGYPIFDLRGFKNAKGGTLGPVEFVRRIEEILIRTCGDMNIPCGRIPGLTGVWTDAPQLDAQRKKIAAIGIHISRAVTSHGFALNANADLGGFDLIVPCGISNCGVASMENELRAAGQDERISMDAVAHSVARNFGRIFGRQILWLQSLADLDATPANQDIPVKTPPELQKLRQEDKAFLA